MFLDAVLHGIVTVAVVVIICIPVAIIDMLIFYLFVSLIECRKNRKR